MFKKLVRLYFLIILIATTEVIAQTSHVVINEIMYTPQSGAPEWFELYNADTQPVNLKNWRMSDATTSRPMITGMDYILQPNGFVVISKDSTILSTFPELAGALLVASVPSLNNTGDDLAIYLQDTTLIERISFLPAWGGATGKSLERKDALAIGNAGSNWATSTEARGATPGRKNSVAVVEKDLAIASLSFSPATPTVGDPVTVKIEVVNQGSSDAFPYAVECYEDENRNDIPEAQELLFRQDAINPLSAGQRTTVERSIPPSVSTTRNFIAIVQYAADENAQNNRRLERLQYGLRPGSVIINEIMYAPSGGEPEWVELYNTTTQSIPIKDWEIADNSTRVVLTDGDSLIPPKGFLIVSKSATIASFHPSIPAPVLVVNLPSLNNSGDEIRLFDNRGARMDSVRFFPEWGGSLNGNSLERIDPTAPSFELTNWNSSIDQARSTPGKVNSIGILSFDAAVEALTVSGKDVLVKVVNVGFQQMSNIDVSLYIDRDGNFLPSEDERAASKQRIASLAKNESATITFFNADTVAGIHTLIGELEASEDQRAKNNLLVQKISSGFAKGTLILNEIMYAPNTDEAEYLEFFNSSSRSVNLQDWKIADQPGASGRTTITLASTPIAVPARAYLVVASDSSLLTRFSYLQNASPDYLVLILNRSSLNLNNDVDEVVLIDPADNIIDSIRYDARWHNPNIAATTGISLERISTTLPATHSTNWSSCVFPTGGTPGKTNSIFTYEPSTRSDGSSLTSVPNPFSPDGDGFEDFTIIRWNLSATVAQIRIRLYDTQGRKVRTIANNIPSGRSGELIFDGLDDDRQRLRIGMYVMLLEGIDLQNNVLEATKRVIVIASKL